MKKLLLLSILLILPSCYEDDLLDEIEYSMKQDAQKGKDYQSPRTKRLLLEHEQYCARQSAQRYHHYHTTYINN